MAFLRTANAIVVQPHVTQTGWGNVRTAATQSAGPSRSLVTQASEILGQPFDPSKYLLTHCTIVASVEATSVPGAKVGSITENGRKINRKYAEYRVSAATDQYINNNLDCFSREVLLKAYRTFVGSHNFLEHVQVEDLSKGRIIDAVTRDIGDSIYVDILVATDRKHADLVADIEGGRLGTLSMGCSVDETICTKCGNVAPDETELCECIRYHKGNRFLDERGQQHRIAELCGHPTLDPTGGVTFIEASWVASPAFTGAVMRNILSPAALSKQALKHAQEVLSVPPAEWTVGDGVQKAATLKVAEGFDFGGDGEEAEAAPEAPAEPATPNTFDKLEDDIVSDMAARVRERVRKDLQKKEDAKQPAEESTAWQNDSIQKAASMARKVYTASVSTLIHTASSDAEVMDRVASLDKGLGMTHPVELYRTALRVGSVSKFASSEQFLSACRDALGRTVLQNEANTLLRLGRILSHAENHLRASTPRS